MDIDTVTELFAYDSDTGHLYWRALGRGRVKTRPAGTKLSTGYLGVVVGSKRYLVRRLCWARHAGPSDDWLEENGFVRAPKSADDLAAEIRAERGLRLSETDWMALSDNTMTPEWASYRQALRDLTAQEGFPHTVEWPNKPA